MTATVKIVGDGWRESFPARHQFSRMVIALHAEYRRSVCARYESGETIAEIAAADGTNIPRIRALLAVEGINIHRGRLKHPGPAWEAEARAAYETGVPVQDIAARIGVARQRVYHVARAQGWKRGNKEK